MNKQDNINKLLFYTKGKEYEKPLFREFWIENGILTLREEQDNGNQQPLNFIFKQDNIPVNEYQSNIKNAVFIPTVEFMDKLKIKITSEFRKTYFYNKFQMDISEKTTCVFSVIEGGRQYFANCEADIVD